MKRAMLNILLLSMSRLLVDAELADNQVRALAKASVFTFEGTVKALNKSNVPNIPNADRALIVSVDNVKAQTTTASKAFGSWIGKEVTVVPTPDSVTHTDLKVGDRATFYTKPIRYADNVAVSAIGITKASKLRGGHFAAIMTVAAEEKANELLKRDISGADAVVTGKVSNVRELTKPKQAALNKPTEGGTVPRVSEHDPEWKEAVITVQAVGKGEPQKEVVVVFPSSDDRMWDRAPKFQKGDAGTWILHKNQINDKHLVDILLAPELEQPNKPMAYTTLDKEDFHPADADGKNQARIQRAIEEMNPQ
jgi:hypothetical protein